MITTVRDIVTEAPLAGVSVSVDGGSPQLTNTSGQISSQEGNVVRIAGHATFVFAGPGDRELWIEGPTSPPPPGGGPPFPLPPPIP